MLAGLAAENKRKRTRLGDSVSFLKNHESSNNNQTGPRQILNKNHFHIACYPYTTNRKEPVHTKCILDMEADPMLLFTPMGTVTLPTLTCESIFFNYSLNAFLFNDKHYSLKFKLPEKLTDDETNWIRQRYHLYRLPDSDWLTYDSTEVSAPNTPKSEAEIPENLAIHDTIPNQTEKSTESSANKIFGTSNPYSNIFTEIINRSSKERQTSSEVVNDTHSDFQKVLRNSAKSDGITRHFQKINEPEQAPQQLFNLVERSIIQPKRTPTTLSSGLLQVKEKFERTRSSGKQGKMSTQGLGAFLKKCMPKDSSESTFPVYPSSGDGAFSTVKELKKRGSFNHVAPESNTYSSKSRTHLDEAFDHEAELSSVLGKAKVISSTDEITNISASTNSHLIGSPSEVKKYDSIPLDFDEPFSFVFKDGKSLSIEKKDVDRLQGAEFLNDNIILFYLKTIQQDHPELKDSLYVFNSFFYEKLKKHSDARLSYPNVRSWTSKANLFSKDFIIIPINHKIHWFVAIVYNLPALLNNKPQDTDENSSVKSSSISDSQSSSEASISRPKNAKDKLTFNKDTDCKIFFCDSLRKHHYNYHVKNLRDFFYEEAKDKLNQEIDVDRISGVSVAVPQQNNLSDCGVYLIHYIELFLQDPYHCIEMFLDDSPESQRALEIYWSNEMLKGKRRYLRRKLAWYRDQQINQSLKDAKAAFVGSNKPAKEPSLQISGGESVKNKTPEPLTRSGKGTAGKREDLDNTSVLATPINNSDLVPKKTNDGDVDTNEKNTPSNKENSKNSSNSSDKMDVSTGDEYDDDDALQFISISERPVHLSKFRSSKNSKPSSSSTTSSVSSRIRKPSATPIRDDTRETPSVPSRTRKFSTTSTQNDNRGNSSIYLRTRKATAATSQDDDNEHPLVIVEPSENTSFEASSDGQVQILDSSANDSGHVGDDQLEYEQIIIDPDRTYSKIIRTNNSQLKNYVDRSFQHAKQSSTKNNSVGGSSSKAKFNDTAVKRGFENDQLEDEQNSTIIVDHDDDSSAVTVQHSSHNDDSSSNSFTRSNRRTYKHLNSRSQSPLSAANSSLGQPLNGRESRLGSEDFVTVMVLEDEPSDDRLQDYPDTMRATEYLENTSDNDIKPEFDNTSHTLSRGSDPARLSSRSPRLASTQLIRNNARNDFIEENSRGDSRYGSVASRTETYDENDDANYIEVFDYHTSVQLRERKKSSHFGPS